MWTSVSESSRHRRKSDVRIPPEPPKRAVIQYDLNNNEVNRFESIAEAARQTGVHPKGIGFVCRFTRKTAGGFIWRYQEGSTTMSEENPSSTAQDAETSDDIV